MNGTYHKRHVTRTIVEERAGYIWCRDAWLDGSTRDVALTAGQLERWMDGAEPGPATRCKIGRRAAKGAGA